MANQIPQNIIDSILESANIVALISEDINLRKNGVNYVGLCPFHADRTPSLIVSPSKRIYKCFACGEGGNVITWFQKYHNLSFPEAVREVAKRCHIEIPAVELSPEQKQQMQLRESAGSVLDESLRIFRANLQTSDDAKAYLASRLINQDTADLYQVGYTSDYNGLCTSLRQLGFNEQSILASGVAYKNDRNDLRDSFYSRLVIPFYSISGKLLGFVGRDITGKQPAKYKNSPDTVLFKKDHILFGLFQARKAITEKGFVYICEGQFDVLSLAQRGVRNVIAASGTAFSEHQRRLLHSVTTKLVFILDGDAAGVKAAMKHIPVSVKDNFEVLTISLPDGNDPDDMAKKLEGDLPTYLEQHTTSYVAYYAKYLFQEGDDTYARQNKVKQILDIVGLEHDRIIRMKFLSELSGYCGYALDELQQMIEAQVPEVPVESNPGFYGMDFAQDYIDDELKEVHLVRDYERFQKLLGEQQPYIYVNGIPPLNAIQELSRQVERVIFHSPVLDADGRNESEDLRTMKEIYTYGLTVDCSLDAKVSGFIYTYVGFYGRLISETAPTPEVKNTYITRCAEMISYASQPIQTVNMSAWAEYLGLKVSALKEVLKPFAQERKSQRKIEKERGDVYADTFDFDLDKVPDYVTQNDEYNRMLQRYGFFPILNKKQEPVSYMFRSDSGSLRRVADFYMQPLFHVYSDDPNENRRVIRLTSLYLPGSKYVEFPSTTFAKLGKLTEQLINKGAYNFEGGTAADYAKIWACMSYNFPLVNEIKVFGQQEEGCFLFANGILHEVEGIWKFEYADELGLMEHDKTLFYSPAFSKVNMAMRKDSDRYEQDRWLVYSETPENKRITWQHWAELMDEVYKINDNGKWAIMYAIMCAFRSDIHPINRLFTSIFFIGPTMSGKTQIAVSIRSLFIKPDAPCFNLNSGTDAAFFSVLERFRDVPQVFEEYNDDMISDAKFQGLKSVTYDGDGKQKRKAATGNDIETSKVNAPVVLLGQEAPQKDDNALSNRVVLCEVPKKEEINETHAREIFEELKAAEKAGLSYLLVEVLKLRPIVQEHFARLQKEAQHDLRNAIESSGSTSGDQTRVIMTVSIFLAMCKLMTTYASHLPLPFTYEKFRDLAIDKVKRQVSMLTKTDKLATFFSTMDFLLDKGTLKAGRDIKIECPGRTIRLKGGREYTPPSPATQLLYMNLSNVHKMYCSAMTGDKPLSITTLEVNLNSHPAFVGMVSNTRFKWQETEEVPLGGFIMENGINVPDATMRKVIKQREKQTSAIVLNYDILRNMLGIDLERTCREEPPAAIEQPLPF